jgi:ABC-type multidrug transport system ATPase subunit
MGPIPAIEVRDLFKRYASGAWALNGVDFTIGRGEVVGYLGPNGAGKTTTLKILTNLVRPSEGHAFIFGVDVQREPKEALRRIGAVIELPGIYEYLTPRQVFHYLGRVQGLAATAIDARAEVVMETVGLIESMHTRMGGFSTGMARRFSLALALLHDPEILLLDEPVLGLDPRGMADIRRVIRTLGSAGKTIFLSSHLLGEVAETCGRVLVIDHGQIVLSGTIAELQRQGTHHRISAEYLGSLETGALRSLRDCPGVQEVRQQPARLDIDYDGDRRTAARLLRLLEGSGVELVSFVPHEQSLEETYLSAVGEEGER